MNMQIKSWEAFLFGTADGEVNFRSIERILKLTSSIAARKGISKILIDARFVTGTLSATERVGLGSELAEHVSKLRGGLSIAFVGHPPTFTGLGVVAARHGGVNVMLFDSIPDALEWFQRDHQKKVHIRAASAHASARNSHPH